MTPPVVTSSAAVVTFFLWLLLDLRGQRVAHARAGRVDGRECIFWFLDILLRAHSVLELVLLWGAPGARSGSLLEEAFLKTPAFYTSGRGVDLHFDAPLFLQIAFSCVEEHAVGDGEAAANRISIYRLAGNL